MKKAFSMFVLSSLLSQMFVQPVIAADWKELLKAGIAAGAAYGTHRATSGQNAAVQIAADAGAGVVAYKVMNSVMGGKKQSEPRSGKDRPVIRSRDNRANHQQGDQSVSVRARMPRHSNDPLDPRDSEEREQVDVSYVGQKATDIRQKPGDPDPHKFADQRPTLTFQIHTEGYMGWFSGGDRQQFISYMKEMFAGRFQLVQAFNDPDLDLNKGEVVHSNSEWTRNDPVRKTIGNMQNPDFVANVWLTVGEPKQTRADTRFSRASGALLTYATTSRVTIEITAVNNRAILEQGTASASGTVTQYTNVRGDIPGIGSVGGGTSRNGAYEASRKAAVSALANAWRDMKKL